MKWGNTSGQHTNTKGAASAKWSEGKGIKRHMVAQVEVSNGERGVWSVIASGKGRSSCLIMPHLHCKVRGQCHQRIAVGKN